MDHQHVYDAQGKQLCCTQEEKINMAADNLIKHKHANNSCCSTDSHNDHSDDDGHNHDADSDSNVKLFLPPAISLIALLIAIALDNYIPQSWFTGWVRNRLVHSCLPTSRRAGNQRSNPKHYEGRDFLRILSYEYCDHRSFHYR